MWNEYFEKINYLYREAKLKKERMREPFEVEKFKWVLGKEVARKMGKESDFFGRKIEKSFLFGIVVENDNAYPEKIELWEKVE